MPPRATFVRTAGVAACLGIALAARVGSANAPAGRYMVGEGPATGTVFDTKTKLTWQRAASTTKYAWADTAGVCSRLQLNGGGWRVATLSELTTLIDFSQSGGPYVDSAAFPSTPSALFWSATPLSGTTATAWRVDFSNGYWNTTDATTAGYVRCVR